MAGGVALALFLSPLFSSGVKMERMGNGIPSATKKNTTDSSLWNLAFEGREPLDLATPSTYRAKLEALRDALQDAWNATPAEKCAPIAKQLQDVLERLETLPVEEGESDLERYRKRAAGSKSAVRRDRATSGVLPRAHNG